MPIFEQFKVNDVQPSYTGPNRPSGFGFDITNRHGIRCFLSSTRARRKLTPLRRSSPRRLQKLWPW